MLCEYFAIEHNFRIKSRKFCVLERWETDKVKLILAMLKYFVEFCVSF